MRGGEGPGSDKCFGPPNRHAASAACHPALDPSRPRQNPRYVALGSSPEGRSNNPLYSWGWVDPSQSLQVLRCGVVDPPRIEPSTMDADRDTNTRLHDPSTAPVQAQYAIRGNPAESVKALCCSIQCDPTCELQKAQALLRKISTGGNLVHGSPRTWRVLLMVSTICSYLQSEDSFRTKQS